MSIAYSFADAGSSLTLIGGTNFGHTGYASFATPLAQNNSAIANLIYAATFGRWTFNPYLQVSRAGMNGVAGLENVATTFGGALLATRKLDDWSIAVRGEGLASRGGLNVLYGPGSSAWYLTLTPTYQKGVFFARAEASYVGIANDKSGSGLGHNLDSSQQARLMLETGVLF